MIGLAKGKEHPMEQLLHNLKRFTTCELADGMVEFATMDAAIKPMVTTQKIVGCAFTIQVPQGEGGIIATALEQTQKGNVIVIAGGGYTAKSYWGDHRSLCAQLQGAEGVIIDGAFRDIVGCEEVGLPIYAKAITPGTAGKTGEGAIQVTVDCGGVTVHPGDIIVADRNGVIVFPPERAQDIMDKATIKMEAQAHTILEMKRLGTVIPKVIFKK